MNTTTVSLSAVQERAEEHQIEPGDNTTLAMLAYDVVTDIRPEFDYRLIGSVAANVNSGEFEFEVIYL